MFASISDDRHLRTLVSAAAVVVLVQGLQAAAGVLNPLLLAAVVVACAAPLQQRVRRRGVGRHDRRDAVEDADEGADRAATGGNVSRA